jgi:hypothetical protein
VPEYARAWLAQRIRESDWALTISSGEADGNRLQKAHYYSAASFAAGIARRSQIHARIRKPFLMFKFPIREMAFGLTESTRNIWTLGTSPAQWAISSRWRLHGCNS